MYRYDYYISEEGSGIMLYYKSNDDLGLKSKIYPNGNIEASLSNCKIIHRNTVDNYAYIYCRLKEEEINYFQNNENLPLAYDILCGVKEPMNAFVHKLDKTKYPVLRLNILLNLKMKKIVLS